MIIDIDVDLENSDWVKKSYDLPVGDELNELLKINNMTMEEFKKLPAYYLPQRNKN